MRIQKSVVAALALTGLIVSSTFAFAGTAYMASSGHPWVGGSGNIGAAWSAFNVGDASVCANNAGSWVIPIPIPTSTGTVTRTVKARFNSSTVGQAWSFTATGGVHSGLSMSDDTNRNINVPAGGTLFVKAVMNSALALACVDSATFVQ